MLDISINDAHYNSDSIEYGRLARSFFLELAENVFEHAYKYWGAYNRLARIQELPLLHSERNLYSLVGSAINAITPIHLSEWPIPMPATVERKRRVVDFWCAHKPSETGKMLNYFIELKKAYYCVSNGTCEDLAALATERVLEAIEQVSLVRSYPPKWGSAENVYLAVPVIHGYHSARRSVAYDQTHLIESLASLIDGRKCAQLLVSTWTLPDGMEIQWENDRCTFIAIAGIVLTKKR